MGDTLTAEQEKRVKRLKRSVEGWRVVLLQLERVLLWEQVWHPAATLATLTAFHLLLWLLEPNTLTLLASIGIIFNLVDFLVPMATAQLVSPTSWTGQQEKRLEDLCRGLVQWYGRSMDCLSAYHHLRQTKPIVYYSLSISGLFLLLWLGKTFNNGLVFYIFTVALAMLPGLLHRGYPQKLDSIIRRNVKKEN